MPTSSASILGFQHVNIRIPASAEAQGRAFYLEFLGLREIEKPASLSERGGFWAAAGQSVLHVSVESGVDHAATRAHVAYEVAGLAEWDRRLSAIRINVDRAQPKIPGWNRLQFRDPFGNLIEMMELEA